MTGHHEDCDGLYFGHTVRVRRDRSMVTATCESCEWRGHTYGPDAADVADREMREHQSNTAGDGLCHGRCEAWS